MEISSWYEFTQTFGELVERFLLQSLDFFA